MGLYLDLRVNLDTIGRIMAHRQERLEELGPDQVATYRVSIKDDKGLRSFFVRHCYDDGAWVLIRKILEADSETHQVPS